MFYFVPCEHSMIVFCSEMITFLLVLYTDVCHVQFAFVGKV